MKTIKNIFFIALLFLITLLTGCAPAYQGLGWIIPVAATLLSLYSFARFFFGVFSPNKEAKGSKMALIVAIAMLLLLIIYIIYANMSK